MWQKKWQYNLTILTLIFVVTNNLVLIFLVYTTLTKCYKTYLPNWVKRYFCQNHHKINVYLLTLTYSIKTYLHHLYITYNTICPPSIMYVDWVLLRRHDNLNLSTWLKVCLSVIPIFLTIPSFVEFYIEKEEHYEMKNGVCTSFDLFVLQVNKLDDWG